MAVKRGTPANKKPTSKVEDEVIDTGKDVIDDGDDSRGGRSDRGARTRFNPRPTVSRHGNSGDLNVIAQYMRDQIQNDPQLKEKDHVIVMDHKLHGGILSCILLCRMERLSNNVQAVTVHTMLVEASAARIPKQKLSGSSGRNLEIDGVAGDVATRKLREDRVHSCVKGTLGSAVQIYDAGVSVIYREVDAKDEKRLWSIFAEGLEAVHRTMDFIADDEIDFSLADVPEDYDVKAYTDMSPAPLFDSGGLPIRSDIAMSVIASCNSNRKDRDSNYDAEEVTLVQVDAFIDLQPGRPDNYDDRRDRDRSYIANAIITSAFNPDGVMSIAYMGLAIHAISLLNLDMGYARVFRQKIARENSWRNIGNIGWEFKELTVDPEDPNPPKPEYGEIPVISHNFEEERWFQLVNDAIFPGLAISIDIGETTGNSWCNGVLIDAANGDPDAYDMVIDAFDNLTNGNFSQCFNVGDELFTTSNNRIAKGYWMPGGNPEDKRPTDDLDHLAALAIWGANDINAVVDFDRTFDEDGGRLDVRLERRIRMMRHVFESEGKMEIKAWFYRLTVNPEVVYALDKAIRMTDVPIELNDLGDNYGGGYGRRRRGPSSLSRYVLDSKGVRGGGRRRRERDDDDRDDRRRSSRSGWTSRRRRD